MRGWLGVGNRGKNQKGRGGVPRGASGHSLAASHCAGDAGRAGEGRQLGWGPLSLKVQMPLPAPAELLITQAEPCQANFRTNHHSQQ